MNLQTKFSNIPSIKRQLNQYININLIFSIVILYNIEKTVVCQLS